MSKKVVIWGYPPHTHTHSYIHLGFAKAFSFLDYDVVWYDDSDEYSDEDLSDAIVISEVNCCKHLPIDKTSKYFIHNIADEFNLQNKIEGDNIYNLLVYHEGYNWNDGIKKVDDFSWFDEKTKTSVIMWATDLLPSEIEENAEVLYDSNKENVNYIGSLSGEHLQNFSSIVESNGKKFVNYGGYSGLRSKNTALGFLEDSESISLIRESYLNFDLRPQVHIDNGYIPCRIFKSISYGCWVGTNSEKILKFFDGRITAVSDLKELYTKTEESAKNATTEILADNKNYVKMNHTYLNRVNSLLSVI